MKDGVKLEEEVKIPACIDGRAILQRNIRSTPPTAIGAIGNWVQLSTGYDVYMCSGGAGVSCVGHECPKSVEDAMIKALRTVAYVPSLSFDTNPYKELCRFLVDSTGGEMTKVVICAGGSEALESSLKFSMQFHVMKGQPMRTNFIARAQSYHGATVGALSLSGHLGRRAHFEGILRNTSHVSPFNPWRDQLANETDAAYVERLANELDTEFQKVGPETIAAFVAEPVVGAAMGSVPGTPMYFKAVKKVCDKYGALLIFDEVMCGMGRTGTLHAWQQMGVVPHIQTIGKGLAGGFQPAAGMLLSKHVVEVLEQNGGTFAHGYTYQGHAVVCAAALEVQRIIQEEKLLSNVVRMGELLEHLLKAKIEGHPHVGNIRGMGLFWGIEFVKDKITKEPFNSACNVGWRLYEMAMAPPFQCYLYPGSGTANGKVGDHVQIIPSFNVSEEEIHFIVNRVAGAIEAFFAQPEFRIEAKL